MDVNRILISGIPCAQVGQFRETEVPCQRSSCASLEHTLREGRSVQHDGIVGNHSGQSANKTERYGDRAQMGFSADVIRPWSKRNNQNKLKCTNKHTVAKKKREECERRL